MFMGVLSMLLLPISMIFSMSLYAQSHADLINKSNDLQGAFLQVVEALQDGAKKFNTQISVVSNALNAEQSSLTKQMVERADTLRQLFESNMQSLSTKNSNSVIFSPQLSDFTQQFNTRVQSFIHQSQKTRQSSEALVKNIESHSAQNNAHIGRLYTETHNSTQKALSDLKTNVVIAASGMRTQIHNGRNVLMQTTEKRLNNFLVSLIVQNDTLKKTIITMDQNLEGLFHTRISRFLNALSNQMVNEIQVSVQSLNNDLLSGLSAELSNLTRNINTAIADQVGTLSSEISNQSNVFAIELAAVQAGLAHDVNQQLGTLQGNIQDLASGEISGGINASVNAMQNGINSNIQELTTTLYILENDLTHAIAQYGAEVDQIITDRLLQVQQTVAIRAADALSLVSQTQNNATTQLTDVISDLIATIKLRFDQLEVQMSEFQTNHIIGRTKEKVFYRGPGGAAAGGTKAGFLARQLSTAKNFIPSKLKILANRQITQKLTAGKFLEGLANRAGIKLLSGSIKAGGAVMAERERRLIDLLEFTCQKADEFTDNYIDDLNELNAVLKAYIVIFSLAAGVMTNLVASFL